MNSLKKFRCHLVIHSHAVTGGGVAFISAQIPTIDVAALVGIEVHMVIKLGSIFKINLTESAAKSLLASSIATLAGRGITQWAVGWIPGYGNIINTATAATIIEGIGWAIANDFDNEYNRGGSYTFENLS